MLKDLNEKIEECRENMALKEILENRNLSLENELNSKEKELGELEKSLNKELKDVQKLKSLSFSNLISNILRRERSRQLSWMRSLWPSNSTATLSKRARQELARDKVLLWQSQNGLTVTATSA